MKFALWKKLREMGDPLSTTTDFHPGQNHDDNFQLAHGAEFEKSKGNNNWEKLIKFYNDNYQNYGGWAAVEKQAATDGQMKAYLDKLKREADTLKPKVTKGGFDDEEWATERWIDEVTQKLMGQMRDKGHGYWEKQAGNAATGAYKFPAGHQQEPEDNLGATRTFHGMAPAPPPDVQTPDPMSSQFGSRVQSLEDRLAQMEKLLSRLKPELFSPQ